MVRNTKFSQQNDTIRKRVVKMTVVAKKAAASRQEKLLQAQKLSMGITVKTIRAGVGKQQIEKDVKKAFNGIKSGNRSGRR